MFESIGDNNKPPIVYGITDVAAIDSCLIKFDFFFSIKEII